MKWIPTSVRMPSEQGQYLVTFPLCNGEPWVYILSFNKGKFYETDDEWGDVEYDDVTAWMPLPKPYTADTPQTEQTEPKSCDNCEYEDLESSEGACDTCEDVKGEPTNWTPKQTEPTAEESSMVAVVKPYTPTNREILDALEKSDCPWK